jgi:hypothetical protein
MIEDAAIARFVAAADTLINLLNGEAPTRPASRRQHMKRIDDAYTEYELARIGLTGEIPGEDEDD